MRSRSNGTTARPRSAARPQSWRSTGQLAEQPGKPARKDGDAAAALAGAAKMSASYEFPYLAHAPMEPLDAVVKLDANSCEIWAGDQFQTVDQANAAATPGSIHSRSASTRCTPAAVSGGAPTRVRLHRRGGLDRQGVWRRRHARSSCNGPARTTFTAASTGPMYFHKLEAGLDDKGELIAWRHVIVGQSIMAGTVRWAMVKDGIDRTSVEGAANLPYDIPNIAVELSDHRDRRAGAVVARRRQLAHRLCGRGLHRRGGARRRTGSLRIPPRCSRKQPRLKAVLELAAGKAGWGEPVAEGKGRGIAVAEAFSTYVAQVAEVTVDADGQIKVDRVVCAVDCGTPINPDVITAQMEGGIGFGLGAVLYGAITLKDGHVEQDNFNGYRVLRMNEMPKVEVHIVPSTEAPTGVGEPGVAPLGPAVANAVFAATGKRLRVLPFAVGGTA